MTYLSGLLVIFTALIIFICADAHLNKSVAARKSKLDSSNIQKHNRDKNLLLKNIDD